MKPARIRCQRGVPYSAALTVLLILFLSPAACGDKSPCDWALVRLDYARREKVLQLRGFCDRIHALAVQAARDELLLACFDINLKYAEARSRGPVPNELADRVAELRAGFGRYYLENYLAFYDILFVDGTGRVFYTLRRESDLNRSLLEIDRSGGLGKCLEAKPAEEQFVDFSNYGPSSEAAAFFVEPVRTDGRTRGWIVLQCAINKLNTLFAWTDDLGETGEAFLVNQEGLMLTESNFEGSSTILTKRLDDRNIQAKFAEGQGHRTVTDYRGCTALTSFEVVEFLGTRWLAVAKMDVHEVITQHYSQHRRYFGDKLLGYLRQAKLAPPRELPATEAEVMLRVDMDEFLKADQGQRLHTFGVSTCTGLLVTYPGKFAYLAHISPKDRAYGAGDTNLVAQMIKRAKTFDYYPCDARHLRFVVVATHLESLLRIVDSLVEEGFMLSQIGVMYNPQAASAAISYDYPSDDLRISWRVDGTQDRSLVHTRTDTVNLESVIRFLMNDEEQTLAAATAAKGGDSGSFEAVPQREAKAP